MNNEPGFNFFQNSGYNNQRNLKKTLILDVSDLSADEAHLGSGKEFSVELFEPLIIDKHSEVYLDSFLTYNSNLGDHDASSAFCLKINEFNIKSNVATNISTSQSPMFDSIIIPNENNSTSNYFATVIHKEKKFNYICDINPGKITRLSGTITDLNGDPIFHGNHTGDNRHTYALMNITGTEGTWDITSGTQKFVPIGTSFTLGACTSGIIIGESGSVEVPSCTTIAGFNLDSPILFFTTDKDLDTTKVVSATTIAFSDPAFTIRCQTSAPPTLLKDHGRFTAEFSIVARD